jgi:hypothetical protein
LQDELDAVVLDQVEQHQCRAGRSRCAAFQLRDEAWRHIEVRGENRLAVTQKHCSSLS